MNLLQTRKKILQQIKPLVINKGWNSKLLFNYSQKQNFSYEEINVLFPEGYKTLINMYLNEVNEKMTLNSKKLNLISFRVHERIRELIILRLKIMLKEKKLITKTFLHLLLPNNHNIACKNLYKTVDQIWFLAGDNSTDFNFYSKRLILSTIYTAIMIHFINNDNLDETIELLNEKLKKASIIPKLKNKIKNISESIFKTIKIKRKFPSFTL